MASDRYSFKPSSSTRNHKMVRRMEHGLPGKEDEPASTQPLDSTGKMDKLTGVAIRVEDVKGEHVAHGILKRGFASGLVKRPHMDSLLTAGYSIVMTQLDSLMDKAARGVVLTPTETKQLAEYVKMIRQMGQEEREQRLADKVSDLSDDALLERLQGTLSEEELERYGVK